jgi:ABC-type dipeptide/oligopeptide/nickel transport system permease subunit
VAARLIPPVWDAGGSWSNILGTDPLGRDLLSRIIYGARISISAGALAVTVSMILGVLMGLGAGYYAGRVDTVISNAVNLMLAFPFLLLALAAVAVIGPGFRNMVIVLGITGWPIYTRVVRAETLKYRERELSWPPGPWTWEPRIIWGHVPPNLVNTHHRDVEPEVARMIILESFLSFLGLGIQPPTLSWGRCWARQALYVHPPVAGRLSRPGHLHHHARHQPLRRRASRPTRPHRVLPYGHGATE